MANSHSTSRQRPRTAIPAIPLHGPERLAWFKALHRAISYDTARRYQTACELGFTDPVAVIDEDCRAWLHEEIDDAVSEGLIEAVTA